MGIKAITKMYDKGNVCVTGLRGCGKDMITANVISRRKKHYSSNIDYKCKKALFKELKLSDLDCGGNTYKNFIEGNLNYYEYPYGKGCDVYISDVGVYFPSQYCNELNRDYKHIPTFMALSRQLADINVHINVQNLNRAWDKLREQSDQYIYCNWCKVLFGKIVFQSVTIYERYESCVNRVPLFKFRLPLFAKKEMKNLLAIERAKYEVQHGKIQKRFLLYINKSKYDTHIFKEMLKNGKKKEI